jgi:hypothetical protein
MPTSEHRAELRTSIAAAVGPRRNPDQQHGQEMAAWQAKGAARRAAAARLDRDRAVAAWCLVPGAAVLPAMLAAVMYGWGPLSLLATLAAAPWLPLAPVAGCAVALVGAGFCVWLASNAIHVPGVRLPVVGAVLVGLLLLTAARHLPVYMAGNGATATDGRTLAGAVIWVYPMDGSAMVTVLAGNSVFRRGEMLEFGSADPVRFLLGEQ